MGLTRTDSLGARVLSREKNYGSVQFATDLRLLPRLKLSGAMPVKLLCVFAEWTPDAPSGMHRTALPHYTLTFT
jgi:hypothetical protein